MACKFSRTMTSPVPMLGGEIVRHDTMCSLKHESPERQLQIYDELFKLGHEGEVVNGLCPMTRKEHACPFGKS